MRLIVFLGWSVVFQGLAYVFPMWWNWLTPITQDAFAFGLAFLASICATAASE